MARLTTLMPGKACDSARPLTNSCSDIHLRLCTNSRMIQPLRPPPKLVTPRRENARNSMVKRSEEHTSELPSLMSISYAVFCLKKKTTTSPYNTIVKPSHKTRRHQDRILINHMN